MVLAALAVVVGCGGDEPNPQRHVDTEPSGLSQTSARTRTDTVTDRLRPSGAADPSRNDAAGLLKGRKAVPAPGGGTFYAPIRPEARTTASPAGCARNDVGEPRPPRPGMRAVRVGPDRVRVRVIAGELPDRCRPAFIRLSFDVNDDAVPPGPPASGPLIAVDQFTPWHEVRLLDAVQDADVVSATAVMRDGESGQSARVLIVED